MHPSHQSVSRCLHGCAEWFELAESGAFWPPFPPQPQKEHRWKTKSSASLDLALTHKGQPRKGWGPCEFSYPPRFYKNGQTTHVTSLGVELLRQGHDVLLVISHLHDPAFSRWLRRKGFPMLPPSIPQASRLVSKWQPQIIPTTRRTIAAMTGVDSSRFRLLLLHYLEFEAMLSWLNKMQSSSSASR